MVDTKWPIEGSTVRLVRQVNTPKPEVGMRPFHEPPTVSGSIKIGMETTIFVPDLETQKAGFTPYKNVDGKPVDATQELLAHYAGIYKRIHS